VVLEEKRERDESVQGEESSLKREVRISWGRIKEKSLYGRKRHP